MTKEQAKEYLKRIGIEDIPEANAGNLGRIIRSHLENVPFEDLDVFDGHIVPSLEEEDLFQKIVIDRRGGYCFEMNRLFYRLLKAMDYDVIPLGVRILWNRDAIPPITHMGIIAKVEGSLYYCDIGYGGPGPKGILPLSPGEYEISGSMFRVSEIDDSYRIDLLFHGEWKELLLFKALPLIDADYVTPNFYCAKSPDVLFTQHRVINICTPTGSKSIMDMELTIKNGTIEDKRSLKDNNELKTVLKEEFGIITDLF